MSDFEMLLAAWLAGGDVPEDFKPSSSIEFILIDILKGIRSTVDPKSRADILLKEIADKYAGYADGITDLRDETGMTEHHVSGSKPNQIAAFLRILNILAQQDLTEKGATGVNANIFDILNAYANLPSDGGEIFKGSAVTETFAMIDVASAATIGINITATAVAALTE